LPSLQAIAKSLVEHPRYTLMRGVARFTSVRWLVGNLRRVAQSQRLHAYLAACESEMHASAFGGIDRADFVARLRQDGVAFGLTLAAPMVEQIRDYAARYPCFADRAAARGFMLKNREKGEAALGKPILLAQYLNAASDCAAIDAILRDPMLRWIAGAFLESEPKFVGANLWWTFPVKPLEADLDLHAQLFHRDVDDFRFFKFFFYLTDVAPGEGAHVCVLGSHRRPPQLRAGDPWNIRRYTDAEIQGSFAPQDIREICGPAGTGFAENTLCIHKGRTPERHARLLLQLQYALFDYGLMHDRRAPADLRLIA
jgi:hypothetical protein